MKWRATQSKSIAEVLRSTFLGTVIAVFAVIGCVNYYLFTERYSGVLTAEANKMSEELVKLLGQPLWLADYEAIKAILDVFAGTELVSFIELEVPDAHMLTTVISASAPDHNSAAALLEVSKSIKFEGEEVGHMTVLFNKNPLERFQHEFLRYNAVILFFVCLILTVLMSLALRKIFEKPLKALVDGLSNFAAGDYHKKLVPPGYQDIDKVCATANLMATEIFARQQRIENHGIVLQRINDAIRNIFSATDLKVFIDSVMEAAGNLTSLKVGVFIYQTGSSEAAGKDMKINEFNHRSWQNNELANVSRIEAVAASESSSWDFAIAFNGHKIGSFFFTFAGKTADEHDLQLLDGIKVLAEEALLRQQTIAANAFNKAELQVAEAVQRATLNDQDSVYDTIQVESYYKAVHQVGGDWYRVLPGADEETFYVIIGDVTGHGLAQGLIATAMVGAMAVIEDRITSTGTNNRGSSYQEQMAPHEIVDHLNNVMSRLSSDGSLCMTAFVARIDIGRSEITYCNAGHTFPLHLRTSGPNGRQLG